MLKNRVAILLVEDNPDDLEMTMRALRGEHICNQIHVARDGEDALDFLFCRGPFREMASGSLPQLVLLDLNLPKVNGLEVLQRIKWDERTKAVPVVVLTSSKRPRDILRSYNLGANSYVHKSFDFDEFRSNIAQVVSYWLGVNEPLPQMALEEVTSTTDACPVANLACE